MFFNQRPNGESTPRISRGIFIPSQTVIPPPPAASPRPWQRAHVFAFAAIPILLLTGVAGVVTVSGESSMATPIVMIRGDDSSRTRELQYGVKQEFSQPDFFNETKTAFVDSELTFIEADLTKMTVAYYRDGEQVFTAPIQSKGREGSWWETPAGLYEISYKAKNHFSSFGQVYQPYSMAFQGNFFIHGWPHHPDGTPVDSTYSGGCIRLSNEDAEELYALAEAGTPVLVHEEAFAGDDFLYKIHVPDISAAHYLIADVNSNTVLAASDLDATVSIASITKLMTALIAAEYINLDSTVRTTQETFVQSLVPRLNGRSQVSMYSLLQLLLVESSNEAAEVIAAQLGRDRFIELMNEKAGSLGLQDTTFVDPSGLGEGNISSPQDLFRLLQYLYHNRSFVLELTANQNLSTAYTSGEFGELVNFNRFEDIDNFIGGKVGETNAAKQTSVSLHRVPIEGEERVIAIVVLGSGRRAEDVAALVAFVERRFGDW